MDKDMDGPGRSDGHGHQNRDMDMGTDLKPGMDIDRHGQRKKNVVRHAC
jgi:hypothetical protein